MTSSFNDLLYKCMVSTVIIAILGCAFFENELKARFLYEELPLQTVNHPEKVTDKAVEKPTQATSVMSQENQENSMQVDSKHGTIMEGKDSEQASSPSKSPETVKGDLQRINTMTIADYDALNGIGPVLAKRIFEDRMKNGPFKSLSDLSRVKGIGDKKLKKILDSL